MTAPAAAAETPAELIARLAAAGRTAQRVLAGLDSASKAGALRAAAAALRGAETAVLAANARDMTAGAAAGLSGAMLDRLKLDPRRVEAIAEALDQIAALPDPAAAQTVAARLAGARLSTRRACVTCPSSAPAFD